MFCSAKRTSYLFRTLEFLPCYQAAAAPGPTLPGSLYFNPNFLLALEWDTPIPSGTTYLTVCTQPSDRSSFPGSSQLPSFFSSLRQSFMHENHVLCKVEYMWESQTHPCLGMEEGVPIPPLTALFEGICHTSPMVGPELELGHGWVFPSVLLSSGYIHSFYPV